MYLAEPQRATIVALMAHLPPEDQLLIRIAMRFSFLNLIDSRQWSADIEATLAQTNLNADDLEDMLLRAARSAEIIKRREASE